MVAITIIVPAHNAATTIGATLTSLTGQTWSDWRCVVVDDGSEDGTGAVAAGADDRRIHVTRQDNAGVSSARNRGLSLTDSRFVLFLDADDALHPLALERLAIALTNHDDAVAAFGTVVKLCPDGSVQPGQKSLHRHTYPNGDVLEPMIGSGFLNVGQTLIRTTAARSADGFRSDIRLSEDWEFLIRLAAQGPFRFAGPMPNVLYHRLSPGGAARSLAANWINHQPFLAALCGNGDLARRLGPARWHAAIAAARASVLWEIGRVNFCDRRFTEARRYMLMSLRLHPTPKRFALFALAEASRVLDRPLANRLRFNDLDVRDAGT